jgi:hypothetical protein
VNGNATLGAGRLVLGDSLIALLLLNEARHHVVARLYGVPREDSNQMTAIAIASMAGGLQNGARVLGAHAVPSVAVTAMGAAVLKETAHGIAGDASRTTPAFGALIAFAVIWRSFGPSVHASYHGARRALHGAEAGTRSFLEMFGGS